MVFWLFMKILKRLGDKTDPMSPLVSFFFILFIMNFREKIGPKISLELLYEWYKWDQSLKRFNKIFKCRIFESLKS